MCVCEAVRVAVEETIHANAHSVRWPTGCTYPDAEDLKSGAFIGSVKLFLALQRQRPFRSITFGALPY